MIVQTYETVTIQEGIPLTTDPSFSTNIGATTNGATASSASAESCHLAGPAAEATEASRASPQIDAPLATALEVDPEELPPAGADGSPQESVIFATVTSLPEESVGSTDNPLPHPGGILNSSCPDSEYR